MRLHLGCGKRHIPGWIHIDAVEFPHIDHVAQIDSLPFIADKSVDMIYACHVLEHFKRKDVDRVLREWRRVLCRGAILRLSVPDFGAICDVYHEHKDLSQVVGLLFGRQDYLYNIHYSAWDYNTLHGALTDAGFSYAREWDCHNVEHSMVDDYSKAYIPHMDTTGTLMSLNIEAVK